MYSAKSIAQIPYSEKISAERVKKKREKPLGKGAIHTHQFRFQDPGHSGRFCRSARGRAHLLCTGGIDGGPAPFRSIRVDHTRPIPQWGCLTRSNRSCSLSSLGLMEVRRLEWKRASAVE